MQIRKSTGDINNTVQQMLREYNAQYMKDGGDYSYCIEESGHVVAGIVASAVFDTVEIEFLCVAEQYRGRGYGELLLKRVESEAAAAHMKRILLNTYSFQAPAFYEKMGYRQLFQIVPVFKDVSQHYFMKEL